MISLLQLGTQHESKNNLCMHYVLNHEFHFSNLSDPTNKSFEKNRSGNIGHFFNHFARNEALIQNDEKIRIIKVFSTNNFSLLNCRKIINALLTYP